MVMKHTFGQTTAVAHMCFGLDRDTNRRFLAAFLQRFTNDALLAALIPRLSDEEMEEIVTRISDILKRHLNDKEYHQLFLDP